METVLLVKLAYFAFMSVWTPGPNNFMLASSGSTYGFQRTVPHAFGVALGFPMMMFVIALGAGEIITRYPPILETMRWIGVGLLVYIGWRIMTTAAPLSTDEDRPRGRFRRARRPFTFIEAVLFQWCNPKAWAMSLGVSSSIIPGLFPLREAVIAALVFAVAGMTSAFSWSYSGYYFRDVLAHGRRLQIFNLVMGMLIAGSALLLLL